MKIIIKLLIFSILITTAFSYAAAEPPMPADSQRQKMPAGTTPAHLESQSANRAAQMVMNQAIEDAPVRSAAPAVISITAAENTNTVMAEAYNNVGRYMAEKSAQAASDANTLTDVGE